MESHCAVFISPAMRSLLIQQKGKFSNPKGWEGEAEVLKEPKKFLKIIHRYKGATKQEEEIFFCMAERRNMVIRAISLTATF